MAFFAITGSGFWPSSFRQTLETVAAHPGYRQNCLAMLREAFQLSVAQMHRL